MANGYTVIGTRFQPFSYDELVKPVATYTDEFNAQEAAYGELQNQAAQWEKLKGSTIDQDVYNEYRTYADELQKVADSLSKEGLKPGGRKAIQNVRRKYIEQITPIEQAYKKRSDLSKLQAEQMAKDPSLILRRNVQNIGLKELMTNPDMNIESTSGAYLEKSAAQAASALAREMRDNPRDWRQRLGGQIYETRMRTGYTADEIRAAIAGAPNAPEELRGVMAQVMQPIAGWDNPEALTTAANYTARGLWQAIGDDKYQTIQNQDYIPSHLRGNDSTGMSRIKVPYVQSDVAINKLDNKYKLASDYRNTGVKPEGYQESSQRMAPLLRELEALEAKTPGIKDYYEELRATYPSTVDAPVTIFSKIPDKMFTSSKYSIRPEDMQDYVKVMDKIRKEPGYKFEESNRRYNEYLTDKYGDADYGHRVETIFSKAIAPEFNLNFEKEQVTNIASTFNSKNIFKTKPSGKEVSVGEETVTKIKKALADRTASMVGTLDGFKVRYNGELYNFTGGTRALRGMNEGVKEIREFLTDWSLNTKTGQKQISENIVVNNAIIGGEIVKEVINTETGYVATLSLGMLEKDPNAFAKAVEGVVSSGAKAINMEHQNFASGPATNKNLPRPSGY